MDKQNIRRINLFQPDNISIFPLICLINHWLNKVLHLGPSSFLTDYQLYWWTLCNASLMLPQLVLSIYVESGRERGSTLLAAYLAQCRSTFDESWSIWTPVWAKTRAHQQHPPPPLQTVTWKLSWVWKSTSTWCLLSWDFIDAGTQRYQMGKDGSGTFWSDLVWSSQI